MKMLKFTLVKALVAYEYFDEPRLIDKVNLTFGEYDAFYMPPLEAQEAFDFCAEKGTENPLMSRKLNKYIRWTFTTIQ